MSNIRITIATQSDAVLLASQLRECDRLEVLASGSQSVRAAVVDSVRLSLWAYAFWLGERLVCIVGVAAQSIMCRIGVPWALGTDVMDELPREVLRFSPRVIALMQADFDVLVNYVHARNRRSIRWLKWCGFTVAAPVGQFCHFSMGD
jgi:hypothetical protein